MALELQSCGTGGTAYTQKTCVVNTATGTSEEVISMGNAPNGDTIYYTKSTAAAGKGTAWAQKGYRFNDQGVNCIAIRCITHRNHFFRCSRSSIYNTSLLCISSSTCSTTLKFKRHKKEISV